MNNTEDLRGEMMVPAAKKLEDLIHLAELCVDLLQQNEEHYAEVSSKWLFLARLCGNCSYGFTLHSSMLSLLKTETNFSVLSFF